MTDMDPESILALQAIRLERIRQVEVRKFTPEEDDHRYPYCEDLPRAAAAYCLSAAGLRHEAETFWPWWRGFEPKSSERDLERAGALIVAELARIYRARKNKESGT